MYSVSNAFLQKIKDNTRQFYWTGTEGMIREYDPEAEAQKAEEQKRLEEEKNQEHEKADVSFPVEGHKAESLKNLAVMVCNRGNLISKATGGHFSCSPELVEILSSANSVTDFMTIVNEHGGLEGIDITDRVYFTGFPDIADRNSIQAFTQLASRMNSISMEQGTVRMKQADAENEKFSFRIWLLGLGMKGEEYKTARRILLAPLKGNTAFRTDEIRERFREGCHDSCGGKRKIASCAVSDPCGTVLDRQPHALCTVCFAGMDGKRYDVVLRRFKEIPVIFGRVQRFCACEIECYNPAVLHQIFMSNFKSLCIGIVSVRATHHTENKISFQIGFFKTCKCGLYSIFLCHPAGSMELRSKSYLCIDNAL